MTTLSIIALAGAAFLAGIVNTIAGGGSFMTFPALLLTGLDPRAANVTSTIALFPMQVSSGYAGRKMVSGAPHLSFHFLLLISLIGGLLGAGLLLLTPNAFFAHLVPWLILFATSIFAYGSLLKKPADLAAGHHLQKRGTILSQLLISIYGGYFGGGIGFLMLATLTLAGMGTRKAGATKNVLAAVMNSGAVMIFMFFPQIAWKQVTIVAVASILGGLIGVRILHLVNERVLRIAVVTIGFILTITMFVY